MSEIQDFAQLGLSSHVVAAVRQIGYERPSPIQAKAIPVLLSGKNLLGTAQTGTGKTAAFALPLISRLVEDQRTPQALVLTPTRELAIQVAEAMRSYAGAYPDFHVLPIYGGQDISIQLRALKRQVHIVVGTPGRLQDHLDRGTLDLSGIGCIVLDEADEMLRMGFEEDVRAILDKVPQDCQRALFSATMPDNLADIVRRHLGKAEEIRIKNPTATVDKVDQRFLAIRQDQKLGALVRILEHEEYDGMLVFVRTKAGAADLSQHLEARGYSSAPLSGDITQGQRERTVAKLKDGRIDVLVATDVAARGLDVDRITHVLNYDMPYDAESYIHRIGRTGRAGRTGTAILFSTPRERSMLRTIEKATRQKITPMQLPSEEEIHSRRAALFRKQIDEALQSPELERFRSLTDSWAVEQDVDLADLAAALLLLAQKDHPLFASVADGPAAESMGDDHSAHSHRDRERAHDRHDRDGRDREGFQAKAGFRLYYFNVGKEHGIHTGHLVGAIAGETGLPSSIIGRIQVFPYFSTVELPEDMAADALAILKDVTVKGRYAKFREMADAPPADGEHEGDARRPFRGHGERSQGGPRQNGRRWKPQAPWMREERRRGGGPKGKQSRDR